MQIQSPRRIAAGGLAVAAMLHLIHLRTHSGEPALFAFFVVTAVTQGALALLLWRTDQKGPVMVGVSLSAGLIALYVATRFVVPPFHLAPEPVDPLGIMAKLAEMAALAALLAIAVRRPKRHTSHSEAMSRRQFLRAGAATAAGVVGGLAVAAVGSRLPAFASPHPMRAAAGSPPGHVQTTAHGNMAVGEVDVKRMSYDPLKFLAQFDRGTVNRMPDGRTVREFRVVAHDREIEIAPGVFFPAWTFNGTVPGPTLRAREGDLVRLHFVNAGAHPHTMHFHGIHKAEMDGVPGIGPGDIQPGGTFTYEFDAIPFGLHLYHCHTLPLKRHIHKGLYGTFIIDPKQDRPPARELVMVMNAFDTNFDGDNEVYAVNTVAFHYAKHPIRVKRNELVRIYLVNLTEFDPINSIHIHGNFFHVYRTGTSLVTTEYTDTIMLCQAERAILDVRFPFAGRFMFHAHQSEFTELGWMGFFDVTDDAV